MDPIQQSLLRDIILNTRKPVVLWKFCPNWKCVDCPIEEWCARFDDAIIREEEPEFEQMPMKFGDFPQWERHRTKVGITFADFLAVNAKDTVNWTAFNYHRSEEIPLECRYDIDFTCFGFPRAAKGSSFWLSSKGANTPCHYDTYGCNIVVQVYGRKQWLLFPPEMQLTSIRVPYEESSVYCSETFFSPKNIQSLAVASLNAFECTLGEGDVLIVPKNWWHYVETLDTSLSVNAWIPLMSDRDVQLQEGIVKYIVEKIVSCEPDENKHYILNPNQVLKLELIMPSEELFDILRILIENSGELPSKVMQDEMTCKNYPYEYLSETEVNNLIEKLNCNASVLKSLHPSEFDNIMQPKTERYVDMKSLEVTKIDPLLEALLNSICHPSSIKVIKDKLLKTYSRNI